MNKHTIAIISFQSAIINISTKIAEILVDDGRVLRIEEAYLPGSIDDSIITSTSENFSLRCCTALSQLKMD